MCMCEQLTPPFSFCNTAPTPRTGRLFLTLYPEQPVTVNTPFGYAVEPDGPPRPEGHAGRVRESARGAIPRSVCGVDGLVDGREYELSVCGGLEVRWWW